MTRAALLAPGYGGGADQPILRAIARALAAVGIAASPMTFSARGKRPSRGYRSELDDLRAGRDALRLQYGGPLALVGRSFGGRMCALLAAAEPPDALAIVGHPIAPPGKPRPADEAALAAVACPTLVVQGEWDELGPPAVLQRIAGANARIDLVVIAGAGHDFGPREDEAARAVARWLDAVLR